MAARTGLPRLPDPPAPLVLEGPDGRRHGFRFRIWRGPAGIEVELEETGVPVSEGFHFAVLGDHDADVDGLTRRVIELAGRAVARCQLRPADHRDGWQMVDDEVSGRLVWNDEGVDGRPYDVVIDGRTLTWEELGHALESYEGWTLRITIESSIDDARTDAEVIELVRPMAGDDGP